MHTAGFGLFLKQLLDKPLDLGTNFVVSRARLNNDVSGGNWANNPVVGPGGAPTTIAAYFIPATALPTSTADTVELRINGTYTLRSHQALHLIYTFMHMTSADWGYEGMQVGSTSAVPPTIEQAFNYNVNVFGVSYVLSF